MLRRRTFLGSLACGAASWTTAGGVAARTLRGPRSGLPAAESGEDVFAFMRRVQGGFDSVLYKTILGSANAFKEGDEIVGVSAADEESRATARALLANTALKDLDRYPVVQDQLQSLLQESVPRPAAALTASWTLAELKQRLLEQEPSSLPPLLSGLSSLAIGCVVKLMSNAELIAVGARIFHPLPGSQIGAKGYLGARIQPNSPTDHVDDIRWQVFDGWSYGVGDVVLGCNPVSSDPRSVAAIETALQELLTTFDLQHTLPHCVLAHIDVQAQVEREHPGSTALWFQSIAGSDVANQTFDVSIDKMRSYAAQRRGPFGFYFETGQGADFTNGHGLGFDMVLHEARKYGFARALSLDVETTLLGAGQQRQPWVHLNDVAGFIGPEVFRTREQLVRCCLEDIVMGKLHGLCIGLDVCSTLHMDVSLDDLDWCLEQVMPANPAYLMALPTKIDPMLGYLTTGFQDHVRLRAKFGYRVDDRLWRFFQELQVVGPDGQPTEHFGDPLWVYLQYRRRQGDVRQEQTIRDEGRQQMSAVRARGVFLAEGRGARPWDLAPALDRQVRTVYQDAKECIWLQLDSAFVATIPQVVALRTRSINREQYILHPESGEQLAADALEKLGRLRQDHDGRYDVQIVVSDGLNAAAIMDHGHLTPFLSELRIALETLVRRAAPEVLLLTSGRVRAGYRIGEALFAGQTGQRAVMHVIGERPGSGHHTFSVYITTAPGSVWAHAGRVDHNITKVVSGIATTATAPVKGARDAARILAAMF